MLNYSLKSRSLILNNLFIHTLWINLTLNDLINLSTCDQEVVIKNFRILLPRKCIKELLFIFTIDKEIHTKLIFRVFTRSCL